MANPQTEDGHVQIANDLWEAIARQNLSGNEFRILLGVLRKLYGFKKKSDWISNRLLAKMTGISYSQAGKMVARLAERKIITLAYLDEGQRRIVKFNKDYDRWQPLPKKATFAQKGKAPSLKKAKHPRSKRQTTKETTTKETITKTPTAEEAQKYFNEKLGRIAAKLSGLMHDFAAARIRNKLTPKLVMKITDRFLKFSPNLLFEAKAEWEKGRYASEGKRENYFFGICRRLRDEAEFRKRKGLP